MRHFSTQAGLLSTLVTFSSLLGACASTDSSDLSATDDYESGVPELAAVELKLTGDPQSEGLAADQDAVDPEALVADELDTSVQGARDDVASELGGAQAAIKNLNQALRASLQPVAAMVRNEPPSQTRGATKTWGPVSRGAADYRFIMRRNEPSQFGWLLQARPTDTEAQFVSVAAGQLAVGNALRRGRGTAVFDLDALGAADPLVAARGTVLVGFAHGDLGTTVGYRLKGFTRDPEASEPIDALIQQVRLPESRYHLRFAYRGDVSGTESELEELVLARYRHHAGVAGRSDAIVIEGDVPEGEAWVVSQCWSARLEETYRIVRSCPRDGLGGESCSVISTTGDLDACSADLASEELPPSDSLQPAVDEEDPNSDVVIPDSFSDVDAPEV